MVDISKIKTFAVIGAGTMGREIAQVALMSESFQKVVLYDINEEALNKGVNFIKEGLKKLEHKGKLRQGITVDTLMARLIKKAELKSAIANADFIVEAVPEIMKIKRDVFEKMGMYSPEHAILATNTSTMSITEIAEPSKKTENVVGMHFFTPIVVLRLIELIKGENTSEETMEIATAIGLKLPALKGKRYIARIDKERPGFIVNRLMGASSIYLGWLLETAIENGIPYEQIDADIGSLQGMGPYAKWDYLGLDVIYNSLNYLAESISPDFALGKTIIKLIEEGNLGRKTGKGLYNWIDGKPQVNMTKKAGLFNPEIFMAIQLNEGCRLLEEGVVSGYKIIDDTMLAGMDMPGPFSAGKRNYQKWSELVEDLAKKSKKSHLKPCKLMKSGQFIRMRK